MMLSELEALTIICATPGLGPIKSKMLLNIFGSANDILNASIEEIKHFPFLSKETQNHWKWWDQSSTWQKNLELAEKQKVSIISYTDSKYPKALLKLPDHPLLLHIKGELKDLDYQSIAIVGTRTPTIYGLEMAEKIARELAGRQMTIVSGLARGIDTAAHHGALCEGRTLAVIGSGLARIYPEENSRLADKIAENGAIVSEFSMLTPPDRKHFPQRNRIVSGMTLGTLLIEAPLKSGAMITMEKALQQNKRLYAIPGRIDHENFKGNHSLIKSGAAALIENGEDIVKSFDNLFNLSKIINKKESIQFVLDSEEENLLYQLPTEELNIEEIIRVTQLPIAKLNILLMSLVIKKKLKEYPGKVYKKTA